MAKNLEARRKLYEDIQMLCAGHDVETALSAIIDSAAGLVAFAATDRAHASQLLEALIPDIEQAVSDNWNYIREIRTSACGLQKNGRH